MRIMRISLTEKSYLEVGVGVCGSVGVVGGS